MIRKITDYIAFRTTKQYTVIKIRTLEPNYWDKDTILLHAVMQLVVDYVEIELSALDVAHDTKKTFKEWLHSAVPWFLRSDEWVRSRTRGLKQLAFEKSLNDASIPENERVPAQAHAAAEIEKVYLWWKDVYPHRPSPYDSYHLVRNASSTGIASRLCATTEEIEAEISRCAEVESQYAQEDAEMLKRVIDVREYLWT